MTMPRTTNATVPIHWSEVKRLFMSSKRLSTASKRKRATGQGSGPVRSMVRKAPFTLRQPCRRAPAQRGEALAESREDRVRWSGPAVAPVDYASGVADDRRDEAECTDAVLQSIEPPLGYGRD